MIEDTHQMQTANAGQLAGLLLDLPVNLWKALRLQELVALREVLAAEERLLRQRGWVTCLEDLVASGGDSRSKLLSEATPEQPHNVFAIVCELHDRGLGEVAPAKLRVRVRLVSLNSQCRVEQQDTLVGPINETAVARPLEAGDVALKFLVDVHERGWNLHTALDGEAETLGLTDVVIRVLSNDDDSNLAEVACRERLHDLVARRKNGLLLSARLKSIT